ncbi:MAG: hypothetical protein QM731_15880 [Chitinophagaceae bacterium]
MLRIGWLQILNILFYIAMIIVNGLANSLPLNGKTTGQLSMQYPNLFAPAPVTFFIWAVIYMFLLLFCIYQAGSLMDDVKSGISKKELMVDKIGVLFILSCILNIAWLFAWHYELLTLSVVIMIALLVVLAVINYRLHAGRQYMRGKEKWFVHVPFGIYLGWISVATLANITALMVSVGWSKWGVSASAWAIAMILLTAIVTIWILVKRHNVPYAWVVVWALAGIVIKQYETVYAFNAVAVAATAAAVLLMLLIFIHMARYRNYNT